MTSDSGSVWTFGNTTAESRIEGDSSLTRVTPVGETIIDKDNEDAQAQLRSNLLQHLASFVNNPDSSDFEFVCSDGVRVKASKLLLKGRSPVFDKFFTSGMRESLQSVVTLPDISSTVILYLLDILYAGNSMHHPLVSWQMALEAISAAHYFLLPPVIKIARKFLWAEVEQVVMNRNILEAASMLTAAMEVRCIVHEEDYIILKLLSLLRRSHAWMQLQYAVNLSEGAVGYILCNTKPDSEQGASLEEYFRVRAVVQWCGGVSQQNLMMNVESLEEAERLVDRSMPSSKDDLYRVTDNVTMRTEILWLPNEEKFGANDGKLCQLLSTKDCKGAIARLLKHIKWHRIPVALLVNIIAPLQILPSTEFIQVLGSHALCRDVNFDLRCRITNWTHYPSCTTDSQGFRVLKSQKGSGRAICRLRTRCATGVLRWCFSFNSKDAVQEEIHFRLARAQPSALSEWSNNGEYSIENFTFLSLMTARSFGASRNRFKPHGKWYSQMNIKSGCLLDVWIDFDRKTRIASTWVQGGVQGNREISSQLKLSGNEDVFPAVDLGSSAGPQVTITCIKEFEFF